jgi:hypothetical protein
VWDFHFLRIFLSNFLFGKHWNTIFDQKNSKYQKAVSRFSSRHHPSFNLIVLSTKSDDFYFQIFHFRFTKMRFSRIEQKLSKFCFRQKTRNIQHVTFFSFFFSIFINCYPPMRTINFGKNRRLFQIKPIKTAEFRFMQFGKKKGKTLHPVFLRLLSNLYCILKFNLGALGFWRAKTLKLGGFWQF